jgi:O-antigen/teichoic acid export membrane protein
MPLLRETIAFGVRSWLGYLAGFLNMRVDQLIMGVIAAKATLGIYAVAVNGAEVLLYLPAAVATVLSPALAQMGGAARQEQALRTFRILALTTAGSAAAAALVGPVFVPLAFGSHFQTSVEPFLWLLPGAFGFAAMKVFGSALLASSPTGRSPLASVAALVTGVVLDLLLIPPLGAVGAAAAASGAFLVGGVVSLLLYRARFAFEWSRLVPGRRDVAALGQLLQRFRAEVRTFNN